MASFTVPCPKISPLARFGLTAQMHSQQNQQKQSLSVNHSGLSPKTSLLFGSPISDQAFSGFQGSTRKKSNGLMVCSVLNEVTAQKSSNSAPVLTPEPGTSSSEKKDEATEKLSSQSNIPDASSISAFMTQVSELVKLVDSRDIMELQLKQSDSEIVIRKKEAFQPPAPVASNAAMPPQPPPVFQSLPPASPAAPAALPVPASPAPAAAKASSSYPPFKCPMAGTFYRSPAPGEPPFVKVGDKVQKGQVICIIEAMKLMNEIEVDQSGTVAEILIEDGKPVSVDSSLFVIVP